MTIPAVLFGVPIENVTMVDTIEQIDHLVHDGRISGRTHQIATVNVDFLVNAVESSDLLGLLQRSHLNLADGMPLIWAAQLVGTPLPERVAGADLVPLLASECASRGWRIHLFGGGPTVAARAANVLLGRHPAAIITADGGPIISDANDVDSEVIEGIRLLDPDILCVALGNPKQERFIAAQASALGIPVMIGIGGSLDMLVGDKKRAPGWAQRTGVEWIFRAMQDPGRLVVRYLHDIRVFIPCIRRYIKTVHKYRTGASLHVDVQSDYVKVTAHRDEPDFAEWERATAEVSTMKSVHISMGHGGSVTPSSHGALIGLLRAATRYQVAVSADPWSSAFDSCLEDFGTLTWIESVLGRVGPSDASKLA
jgi:exopolysaccharide biosynthesis WecB/TagA/CpsF family protein